MWCSRIVTTLPRTPLNRLLNRPSSRHSSPILLRHSSNGSTSAVPTRRPSGTIKGTLFGFLLGSTIAGGLSYYYFLEEYKTANELLTEDVDALRASILRIEQYVRSVEEKLAEAQKSGELVKRR